MLNNQSPIVDKISHAFRDPSSGAVVIDDPDGYKAAKQRKTFYQRQEDNEKSIQSLKSRIDTIDKNVEMIVNMLLKKELN